MILNNGRFRAKFKVDCGQITQGERLHLPATIANVLFTNRKSHSSGTNLYAERTSVETWKKIRRKGDGFRNATNEIKNEKTGIQK